MKEFKYLGKELRNKLSLLGNFSDICCIPPIFEHFAFSLNIKSTIISIC